MKWLTALALVLFSTTAHAAQVQSFRVASTGSTTTWTTSAFTAIGTGNALVFVINSFVVGGVPAISSVVDNAASPNTYTLLSGPTVYDNFNEDRMWLYGLTNIKGNPTTLTITFAATGGGPSIAAGEYSNVAGFEAASIQYISSTTATPSISITTANSGDTIWGYGNNEIALTSAGAGYTLRLNDPTDEDFTEDLVQASAGAVNVNWTWSGTNADGSLIAGVGMIPATPLRSLLGVGR